MCSIWCIFIHQYKFMYSNMITSHACGHDAALYIDIISVFSTIVTVLAIELVFP